MLYRPHRHLVATSLSLALILVSPPGALGDKGEEHPVCRPTPEMAEIIDDLEHGPECGGAEPCWRERIARTETLLAEHPDDVLLHRAYQDLFRTLRGDDAEEAWKVMAAGYATRLAEHPDDPASHYLAARVEEDEAKGLEEIERGLALDPEYPWLHMGAAALLTRLEPERTADILGHIATFEGFCPENLNGLYHARWLDAPDFWRPRLVVYRRLLAADTPGYELGAYRHLWTTDFSVTPVAEHDAVRERIRDDLAHLATRDRAGDEMWWMVRRQGTQMLGDPEALATLDREMNEILPCNDTAVEKRLEPWTGDPAADPPDTKTLRATLAASDEWIALCPKDFRSHFLRFKTVSALGREGELGEEKLRREADRMLAVWEKMTRAIRMSPSIYARVADLFLDHGFDLDRVDALLDQDEALAEANAISPDQLPEGARARFAAGALQGKIRRQTARLRAALAHDRPEDARRWLGEIEATVAEFAELSDEPAWTARQRANLIWVRGLVAEHEERWLDALLLYRRALADGASGVHSAILETSIDRLWTRLGGSDEGRALLETEEPISVATEPSLWRPLDQPLPELELTDLTGKSWRRDDFLGTATLVNFWATSCVPCRVELPHLQALAAELEPLGIRVVTLNIDQDVGLVQPFVESEKLGLPVLLAQKFFRAQGLSSVPTSWIIDPGGTIRHQQVGFSPLEQEQWIEQTRDLLLEAAGQDG